MSNKWFIQSIPVGYDLDGQPDGILISDGSGGGIKQAVPDANTPAEMLSLY